MDMMNLDFYKKPTLEVAESLIGKVLVVKNKNNVLSGKIVETEAYIGSNDKACHASWRKRVSCENLWKGGGIIYVYLTYGMHYMLNIVTEKDNFPSAVLIRAVEPLEGIDIMVQNRHTENIANLTSGPAKLTKAFGINKSFNGKSLLGRGIYVEDRNLPVCKIESSKRVGVDYAEEPWKSIEWRFYQSDSSFVSKRK